MSHPLPSHADRVARSLKRLRLLMTRAGRSFSVVDAGELAVNSEPGMSLAEIEQWIGEFIKPKPKRVTAAMWVGLKNKSSGQGVASLSTSAYFDA